MRVLIIEDDESIALIEKRALEQDGFETSVRASGAEALDELEMLAPDLVILDQGLPDIQGRDVLRSIRERSRVPVIVVTARAAEAEIVESMDLGADDYVVKPFRTPELMARVRAVLRRSSEPPEQPGPLRFRDLVVDERSRRVTRNGTDVALTRIEFDILRMLMRRPGETMDRQRLAIGIWNLPADRIGKSLDVHMSVLRRKLGDDPKSPSYIETVRGVGFRIAGR